MILECKAVNSDSEIVINYYQFLSGNEIIKTINSSHEGLLCNLSGRPEIFIARRPIINIINATLVIVVLFLFTNNKS